MTLADLFQQWYEAPKVGVLSIATSGLKPDQDEVIGFATVCGTVGSNEAVADVTLRFVPDKELLEPAQAYHKITPDNAREMGLQPGDFLHKLERVIKDNDLLFTYNVPFQFSFIENALQEEPETVQLYDLSVVYRALDCYTFDSEDLIFFRSFYSACCSVATPMSVASICRKTGMSREADPGQFPMERMALVLRKLFEEACAKEVHAFQS